MSRTQAVSLAYLVAVFVCVLAGRLPGESLVTAVPALLLGSPLPGKTE